MLNTSTKTIENCKVDSFSKKADNLKVFSTTIVSIVFLLYQYKERAG